MTGGTTRSSTTRPAGPGATRLGLVRLSVVRLGAAGLGKAGLGAIGLGALTLGAVGLGVVGAGVASAASLAAVSSGATTTSSGAAPACTTLPAAASSSTSSSTSSPPSAGSAASSSASAAPVKLCLTVQPVADTVAPGGQAGYRMTVWTAGGDAHDVTVRIRLTSSAPAPAFPAPAFGTCPGSGTGTPDCALGSLTAAPQPAGLEARARVPRSAPGGDEVTLWVTAQGSRSTAGPTGAVPAAATLTVTAPASPSPSPPSRSPSPSPSHSPSPSPSPPRSPSPPPSPTGSHSPLPSGSHSPATTQGRSPSPTRRPSPRRSADTTTSLGTEGIAPLTGLPPLTPGTGTGQVPADNGHLTSLFPTIRPSPSPAVSRGQTARRKATTLEASLRADRPLGGIGLAGLIFLILGAAVAAVWTARPHGRRSAGRR